jgi:hypothetical protein
VTIIFAVSRLFDAVKARFDAENAPRQVRTLDFDAIAAGQAYGVTINGSAVSVTAGVDDTLDSVCLALNDQIEALAIANLLVVRTDTGFEFRNPASSPVTFAAPVHATLTDVSPAPLATVNHRFGWRAIDEQGPSTPRLVWVPGDDSNGGLGEMGPAHFPGDSPERSLMTMGELVTVYVEDFDATNPEDEATQYKAVRALFDAFMRAVYRAAKGTFLVRSAAWVIDKKVRRRGAAIRVLLAVDAKIPDAPYTVASTQTKAEVTPALSRDGTEANDVIDSNSPDVIEADGG